MIGAGARTGIGLKEILATELIELRRDVCFGANKILPWVAGKSPRRVIVGAALGGIDKQVEQCLLECRSVIGAERVVQISSPGVTSDVRIRPVSLFHILASGTLWAVDSAAARAITLFSFV